MISGTVGDEEAVRCLHLGATDYLLKDRLERLASAVERAIQEAETRRARRLTEAKLQQSEQLNRSLVEHLPQRMFVKDLNFNYVFCNSTLRAGPGDRTRADRGSGRFRVLFQGTCRRVPSRRPAGHDRREDHEHGTSDTRWLDRSSGSHTVKIPYRDEQGEIIGVLGLIEDISERKLVEGQRERLAALVDASPRFHRLRRSDNDPDQVHQQGRKEDVRNW